MVEFRATASKLDVRGAATAAALILAACGAPSVTTTPGTASASNSPAASIAITPSPAPSSFQASSSPSNAPGASASSAPTPVTGALDWHVVTHPPVNSFLAGGQPGFVDIVRGTACSPICPVTGAFYSPDGEAWHEASSPADTFADAVVQNIAPYKSGFIAVGAELGSHNGDPVHGAAWASTDGTEWHRLVFSSPIDLGTVVVGCHHLGNAYFGYGMFTNVATVGDHIVALALRQSDCQPADWTSSMWTSDDGVNWRQAAIPGGFAWAVNGPLLGGRTFVAMGWTDKKTQDVAAGLWNSADGQTWQATDLQATRSGFDAGERLLWLADQGDRYLAFADDALSDTQQDLIAWSSNDGLAWQRLNTNMATTQHAFGDVIALGPLLVAVGTFGQKAGSPQDPNSTTPIQGVITSMSGADWSVPDTAPFDGHYPCQLVAAGRHVLATDCSYEEAAGPTWWVASLP